jgi:acyl-CoA thioesterase FadM
MKQLFRLFKILILSRFQPKMTALDESTVCFRVWPNDLDPYMHMNNGVYLTLLDLGRINLMARSGMMKLAKQEGYYPVVASEAIKFRISLLPFQKFQIVTRMVGWDDRYFYIRQQFVVKDQVAASAFIKGRILSKKGGKVSPPEMFKKMGLSHQSPPLPSVVQKFLLVDEELR